MDALAGLGAELYRITRLVHDTGARSRDRLGPLPEPVIFGALVELRTALLAGGLSIAAAEAIYPYQPEVRAIWSRAREQGWIAQVDGRLLPTDLTTGLFGRLLAVHDEVTTQLWGDPSALLRTAGEVLDGARCDGPAFAAWRSAGTGAAATPGGRLFISLTALRYLRADVHAASWTQAGFDAVTVQELPPDSAARVAIEADTDERLATALASVDPGRLTALSEGVRHL